MIKKMKRYLKDEPDLEKRIKVLKKQFHASYKTREDLIVRSPGRAEIIGNHTDYNQGFALSACISKSFLVLFKKRDDKYVQIYSNNYPTKRPVIFSKDKLIKKDSKQTWTNYARGVIQELCKRYGNQRGADILIDSNVPIGTGVSTSAALELAIAYGFLTLSKQKVDRLTLALLCQKVENNYVGTPCGFLDQGTIAFGKSGKLIFLDFLAKENSPVSKISLTPANLEKFHVSFVVVVDKTAKRELGASGYPARRKMCEDSLSFWARVLNKKITSLRNVTVKDFEKYQDRLNNKDELMRKRVEHIVYENERVLDAKNALKQEDIAKFGNLLTESGKSALSLYELDERTPELTFLFEYGRTLEGVIGIRNMGGGFSATILALVKKKKLPFFKRKLNLSYQKKFGRDLEFIEFKVTGGVSILKL